MAIMHITEMEATPEQYDAVSEKVMGNGDGSPDGMVVHTAADLGDGKMRVIDVWETREALDKFRDETLRPAVEAAGGPEVEAEPPGELVELHHLVRA